jgi:hypothetical protein
MLLPFETGKFIGFVVPNPTSLLACRSLMLYRPAT